MAGEGLLENLAANARRMFHRSSGDFAAPDIARSSSNNSFGRAIYASDAPLEGYGARTYELNVGGKPFSIDVSNPASVAEFNKRFGTNLQVGGYFERQNMANELPSKITGMGFDRLDVMNGNKLLESAIYNPAIMELVKKYGWGALAMLPAMGSDKAEAKGANMPGEYLDPSQWPLWMQSAEYGPQARTFPQDLHTPRLRRMMLNNPSPIAQEGIDEATSLGLQSAIPMGAAMKLLGQGVRAVGAPMLGATSALLSSSDASQTAEDPVMSEMLAIQRRLERNNAEVTRLGTTMTKSPRGTQDKAIDTLRSTITADQNRLEQLQGQITERENRARSEADAKRNLEMPFNERYAPYTYALPAVGAGLGYLSGRGIGKFFGNTRAASAAEWNAANSAAAKQFSTAKGLKSPNAQVLASELEARQAAGLPYGSKPMLAAGAAGGAVGGLEGFAIPYMVNELDAASLPTGSANQVQAANNATNPDWLMGRAALPAGMGMLAGGLGGALGLKGAGVVLNPAAKTAGLLDAWAKNAAKAGQAAMPQAPLGTPYLGMPPQAFSGQLPRIVQDGNGNWVRLMQ